MSTPSQPEAYIESGTYFAAPLAYAHAVMLAAFRSMTAFARSASLIAFAWGGSASGAMPAPGHTSTPSTGQRKVEFVPGQAHLTGRSAGAKAHPVYSAFDSAGFSSLSCEGTVDWETLFRGHTSGSFREQVLPVLKGTRFVVTLDKDGIASIEPRHLVAPATEEAARRAEGAIQTFKGVIAAVLQGWARFAVAADLPTTADEYLLDGSGDHYLVAFSNGPADVAISLDRSYSLEESARNENTLDEIVVGEAGPAGAAANDGTRTASRSMRRNSDSAPANLQRPEMALTSGGFLVADWAITFPRGDGRPLLVEARYMRAGGIPVPAAMVLHSSLPSFGEVTLPLSLNNYQFER